MRDNGKQKENKLIGLISSSRLRALESKKSSRYAGSKQRVKFVDPVNSRPMFNPIAGP